jgi:hypothetical protein
MAVEFQLTIDCTDARRLVPFWAEALGYQPADPPAGFASWKEWYLSLGEPDDGLPHEDWVDRLVDPRGVGPRIWFQPVPEPKTVKNRLHLDLKVSGGRDVPIETRRQRVDAKVERLTALGGTVLRTTDAPESGSYYIVMQDPEGNEFCVT